MKKWVTKKGNLFTFFLLIFVLFQQAPLLLENLKNEGGSISSEAYEIINKSAEKEALSFPPKNSRTIAIFWATWCGPCKIEMNRLKASVESGKIPADAIVAINPFESKEVVKKFVKNNASPFTFIEGQEISQRLNIRATPTTMFIENGRITSISSGMSIFGIWKAENFL